MPEKKYPFRYGTRQNVQPFGSIPFAASQTKTQELPRVGFLSRVIVQFTGTIHTSGGGSVMSNLGPWNLVRNIRVNTNINSFIWNTSGYGAYLEQFTMDRGYAPDKAGIGSTTVDTNLHAAPIAAGDNTWVLTWVLSVGGNQGSNFEAGMLNLQSPQTRVTVEIDCGALTDAATLIDGVTGNFNLYYEYYELPDPRRFMYPPLNLVRTIEDVMPIGGVGPNIYQIPRQGTLLHLIHYLRLNNARSNSFDSGQIRFNYTTFPYQVDRNIIRLRNREFGTNDFPPGVYLWDWWHSGEDMSAGDNRDVIDTEKLSTVESIINVSSGAALGVAGTNFFNSIRRIVQVFQQ